MNFNALIRQIHRWLSILFTLAVILNIVALVLKHQAVWIGLLALFPLILLMISGLYMFVLPYVAKRRGGPGAG
ncbi:cellulose synthase/poly-beta-1,6-N-acetylglucosamine synthase-like glycosyltransferase [Caulobacter ginsengisoli]|uniref:Cellulose synthase/poly-beta-1,6-N-acetylglucosamine synthase-like glycosyltransferase n=1 Tax=Caulobacter ginsengisoli TaxID=400775 RepID=A0ABU0IX26_9CAUL|nr:hypothetical protein [Caulobacter ginsengisoli]MDQ0466554.1 cellulose synthase/poly-beta-1,6-N-acetylglucosamine synthase-like glycosyltransferase [Caulobacter ginsengisoli]